jgi:glucose dehydrogenase
VHANKSGYIFVYDRSNAKVENVWPLVKNINFVKSIDPKTGELIGRRDFAEGKVDPPLCPAIMGGISWNSGAYSPKNGLFYRIGQEWCMELTVEKTTPILEPMAQLNIGATFKFVAPPDGPARGHLSARDPVTGAKKWEVNYKQPPLASVLATAGNLVFVPDSEGIVHAYNADTGEELWSRNNGMGHNAGIISYMAGGKQYIAVPAGWGSLVADEFVALYGEPFKSMPKNTGALVVFALRQ